MKRALYTYMCCGVAAMVSTAVAANEWLTDYEAAVQQAEADGKYILMDFTGSDWCSVCVRLRRSVLEQADFAAEARLRCVFLEVDLPQRKAMDAKLRAANEALCKRYRVDAFPTIMIINSRGEVLGGFAGDVGGVKNALACLDAAAEVEKSLRAAEGLSGSARARALMGAYRNFPRGKAFAVHYEALRAEIARLDTANETGIMEEVQVLEQAERFAAERAGVPFATPAYGALLERQLAEALPANRAAVMMERCQHSLGMADSVEELEATRRLFEECLPYLPEAEAASTREFLELHFKDLPALLRTLRNSRR